MNDKTELDPCPFCGGEANISSAESVGDFERILCSTKGCFGGSGLYLKSSRQQFIDRWNTREPQWVDVKDGSPDEGSLCLIFDGREYDVSPFGVVEEGKFDFSDDVVRWQYINTEDKFITPQEEQTYGEDHNNPLVTPIGERVETVCIVCRKVHPLVIHSVCDECLKSFKVTWYSEEQ